MKKGLLIGILAVCLLLGVFLITRNLTGNVSLNFENTLQPNDQVTGNLKIILEKGDSIEKNTPIIVSLSKKSIFGEQVIEAETLTFDEFVKMSSHPVAPTEKDGKFYYETPGVYEVETSKILTETVKEGEYEVYFKIFSPDITIRKSFLVR